MLDTAAALAAPARLSVLEATGLMDSEVEPVFDRAVRVASRLLGAPVALLSLVDTERQFFRSQVGSSGWPAEQRQTPLSHSFCQHVGASRRPLIAADAREDDFVSTNLAARRRRVAPRALTCLLARRRFTR